MKKLYYISWNGTCARFTRCFDSKAERDKFEKDINPNKNISTLRASADNFSDFIKHLKRA